jgi:hypothetical protein
VWALAVPLPELALERDVTESAVPVRRWGGRGRLVDSSSEATEDED